MSDAHQTLGLERCRHDLHVLHDLVIRSWGRIEITHDTDGELGGSVLISKAELHHMERALEILCQLPGGHAACEELARLAEKTTPRAYGAAILSAADSISHYLTGSGT